MPTQIFINGRFLTKFLTGVHRYAIETVKAMDEIISTGDGCIGSCRFTLITPKNPLQNLSLQTIQPVQKGSLKSHAWEQLELPFYSRGGWLINLCNTAPICKRNQIVTIHDTSIYDFPEGYSAVYRLWYRFVFRMLKMSKHFIITDSQYSKSRISKLLQLNEEEIRVAYLGREHIEKTKCDPRIIQKIGSSSFILCVGSLNKNKNSQGAILGFLQANIPGCRLVIAGAIDPIIYGLTPKFESENILYLGYVSDGELKALYEHAALLVYPSLNEGFGLPPLEAMACGCPVVVSKRASLPEVCGEAALYCDPEDPTSIGQKISEVMCNPDLQTRMKKKGLDQCKRFSWYETAKTILNCAISQ